MECCAPEAERTERKTAIAAADFSRLEIRKPAGGIALLDAHGDQRAPLVALVIEAVAAEWPDAEVTVERFLGDSWLLSVGRALTRGMSVQLLAKDEDVLVLFAPHTKLASALTTASALGFVLAAVACAAYSFFAGGASAKWAIFVGAAAGAIVAAPLFGLAWLSDNVLNPFGRAAVAKLRDSIAGRVSVAFPVRALP